MNMIKTSVTQSQIDEARGRCTGIVDTVGTEVPGLTYEEGVKAALEWFDDDMGNEHPLGE